MQVSAAVAAQTKPETARPNIVFMMADNLGYGDLGAYGGGEIRGMPTPRIDALASEGVRFTQFLVEPGCTPSRAATMTGRYSTRSGLSLVVLRGTSNTLAAEEVTMAEVLKGAGYDTAYLGKWHLGTWSGTDLYRRVAAVRRRARFPSRATPSLAMSLNPGDRRSFAGIGEGSR